jgi:hypothetical protein
MKNIFKFAELFCGFYVFIYRGVILDEKNGIGNYLPAKND